MKKRTQLCDKSFAMFLALCLRNGVFSTASLCFHSMKISAAVLPFAIPSVAYASGGDILSLMVIELGLFVAILIFTFVSKLALKYRATVFFIYVISVIIATWSTSSLRYSNNIILINSTNILLPIAACVLAWKWCVKQTKAQLIVRFGGLRCHTTQTLDYKGMNLLPPSGHKLSLLCACIAYPIGKLALRLLTFGYYPSEDRPHNAMFVALTPWWLFGIIITLIYS